MKYFNFLMEVWLLKRSRFNESYILCYDIEIIYCNAEDSVLLSILKTMERAPFHDCCSTALTSHVLGSSDRFVGGSIGTTAWTGFCGNLLATDPANETTLTVQVAAVGEHSHLEGLIHLTQDNAVVVR